MTREQILASGDEDHITQLLEAEKRFGNGKFIQAKEFRFKDGRRVAMTRYENRIEINTVNTSRELCRLSYSPEAIWAIIKLIEDLFNPLELISMAEKLYKEVIEAHREDYEAQPPESAQPSQPSQPTNEEIKYHAESTVFSEPATTITTSNTSATSSADPQ